MHSLVIYFDSLTPEQQSALNSSLWKLLEDLDVDYHTLVKDGKPCVYTAFDVQAHDYRNAQAAAVAEALAKVM